jgi:hypothetical protein
MGVAIWGSLFARACLAGRGSTCDEESMEVFPFGQQARVIVASIIDHDGAKTGQLTLMGEPQLQRDSAHCWYSETSTGIDRSR